MIVKVFDGVDQKKTTIIDPKASTLELKILISKNLTLFGTVV